MSFIHWAGAFLYDTYSMSHFEWLIYSLASDETNAAEAQSRTQIEKTSTEKLEIWICSRQSDSNISIQSGQSGYNNSISTAIQSNRYF